MSRGPGHRRAGSSAGGRAEAVDGGGEQHRRLAAGRGGPRPEVRVRVTVVRRPVRATPMTMVSARPSPRTAGGLLGLVDQALHGSCAEELGAGLDAAGEPAESWRSPSPAAAASGDSFDGLDRGQLPLALARSRVGASCGPAR